MKEKKVLLYTLLFFIFSSTIYAQNNSFVTIDLYKEIKDTKKWNLSTLIHWKQYYEKDGWGRVGIDLLAKRKLGDWFVSGGVATNYTFDETIANYWEIKPWTGVGLNSKIYRSLSFNQYIRFEWRNLIFSDDTENKITTRVRYRIRPTFLFPNKENANQWGTYIGYEWYFLPNEDLGTRFINSAEFVVAVFKNFSDKYQLRLSYSSEKFNAVFNPNEAVGHTFGIFFSF